MRIYQTFITNMISLYIFSGNINFYRKVVFDFENMGFLLWERRKEGKRDAVGKERERERKRENKISGMLKFSIRCPVTAGFS